MTGAAKCGSFTCGSTPVAPRPKTRFKGRPLALRRDTSWLGDIPYLRLSLDLVAAVCHLAVSNMIGVRGIDED